MMETTGADGARANFSPRIVSRVFVRPIIHGKSRSILSSPGRSRSNYSHVSLATNSITIDINISLFASQIYFEAIKINVR